MPKYDSHILSPKYCISSYFSSFNKCITWYIYDLGLINSDVIA